MNGKWFFGFGILLVFFSFNKVYGQTVAAKYTMPALKEKLIKEWRQIALGEYIYELIFYDENKAALFLRSVATTVPEEKSYQKRDVFC